MPSASPYLSLIIPCYRQEKIIIANLRQLLSALDKTRYSYEIIVVIDGEIDQTFAKIKKTEQTSFPRSFTDVGNGRAGHCIEQ